MLKLREHCSAEAKGTQTFAVSGLWIVDPLIANACVQLQANQERNIRQIPIAGHPTKYLQNTSTPENRHQKQGKSENLSQTRGAYGSVTVKCNMLSWMESRNRKMTFLGQN